MVPFFAYTTVFLVVPTLVVVVGAFTERGADRWATWRRSPSRPCVAALQHSVILSAVTAVAGAAIGAVLAYAVSTATPAGVLTRFVTSLCGVLAQFGGVALAFAFLASFGATGFLTTWLARVGVDAGPGLWLYEWDKGLMLVYLYFQIPLMLIVFLPAVEGLRPQWREATETLGGSTRVYWRRVGWPDPAALLRRRRAAAVHQRLQRLRDGGCPGVPGLALLPLAIGNTLTSEVILGQENIGKAMALAMVVVVAVAMSLYAVLDRRASKWLAP